MTLKKEFYFELADNFYNSDLKMRAMHSINIIEFLINIQIKSNFFFVNFNLLKVAMFQKLKFSQKKISQQ